MKRKKILVVDDEVDLQAVISARLKASNYDVIIASSGKEALEKIKKEKPDAVLLDILMPEMDGINVLERIRQDDKELPVFMITAFSNEARFKSANKLNATGFIDKTSDFKTEIEKIKEIIG